LRTAHSFTQLYTNIYFPSRRECRNVPVNL
jgi:hypothetical protein